MNNKQSKDESKNDKKLKDNINDSKNSKDDINNSKNSKGNINNSKNSKDNTNNVEKKENSRSSKKIKILRIVLIIFIICWAVLIFNFSNENGEKSSNSSTKLIELFIKNKEVIEKIDPYIRKIAHYFEYGLGGVLFIALFYTYNWTDRKRVITSLFLGLWYSITDELHQSIVPGRHASLADIWIDFLGIATGVVIMIFIITAFKLCRKEKILND